MRSCEQVCEIDEKYGVLDYSIKSKSRKLPELDRAYWQACNDLTVWTNVRVGNALLLEYDLDEDARLK